MSEQLIAGIETGGTKILARIADADGKVVANGRWPTSTSEAALQDLVEFVSCSTGGARLAAIGMAAFGPLVTDHASPDYGLWPARGIAALFRPRTGTIDAGAIGNAGGNGASPFAACPDPEPGACPEA